MSAHEIEVFYDGQCPVCIREMERIRRRDRGEQVLLTDLNSGDLDITSLNVTRDDLLDRIHARLNDGRVIEGVEVFRHLYRLFGFGALVALTRIPGISHGLDMAYARFAKRRTRLAGRCEDGGCAVDQAKT